jgi:antitoxin VapB
MTEAIVADIGIAKLFKHGRSQAVRLPKEFRMPGTEVRVRRLGSGVLLEPMERNVSDIAAIFDKLKHYRDIPFMEEGRNQPPMPPQDDVSFD